MGYEIQRALERLDWEIKKDKDQTDEHKRKLIEEIKSWDKSKILNPLPPPKKKISLWTKILIVMGHGKKR
jgi:hypothetical protein